MTWLGERRRKQNPGRYRSPITEKWFEKGNDYEPQQGKEYQWVWEYAQFRFTGAMETGRYVDDKSVTILKFASAVGAGAWAVFTFFESEGRGFVSVTVIPILLALACLLASSLLAAAAFNPANHLYPANEKVSLECADHYSDAQQAMAKSCWGLTASTQFEHQVITKKGKRLKWAMWLLAAAVLFFILSICAMVFR